MSCWTCADLLLDVRECAHVNEHGPVRRSFLAQIAHGRAKEKRTRRVQQCCWKVIDHEGILMFWREDQVSIFDASQHVDTRLLPKHGLRSDVVCGCLKTIDEVTREQVTPKHVVDVIRIDEDIRERRCRESDIA
jgi:hypothetical protein